MTTMSSFVVNINGSMTINIMSLSMNFDVSTDFGIFWYGLELEENCSYVDWEWSWMVGVGNGICPDLLWNLRQNHFVVPKMCQSYPNVLPKFLKLCQSCCNVMSKLVEVTPKLCLSCGNVMSKVFLTCQCLNVFSKLSQNCHKVRGAFFVWGAPNGSWPRIMCSQVRILIFL